MFFITRVVLLLNPSFSPFVASCSNADDSYAKNFIVLGPSDRGRTKGLNLYRSKSLRLHVPSARRWVVYRQISAVRFISTQRVFVLCFIYDRQQPFYSLNFMFLYYHKSRYPITFRLFVTWILAEKPKIALIYISSPFHTHFTRERERDDLLLKTQDYKPLPTIISVYIS